MEGFGEVALATLVPSVLVTSSKASFAPLRTSDRSVRVAMPEMLRTSLPLFSWSFGPFCVPPERPDQLLGTSASLVVTSALLLVTSNKKLLALKLTNSFLLLLVRHLLLLAMHLFLVASCY